MSLIYQYKPFPLKQPAIALGGAMVRYKPIIPVTVIGPTGSKPMEGLLDNGSDDTIFEDALAAQLGIDLTGAPFADLVGVGSGPIRVRYATVTLRLWNPHEQREWSTMVGFTPAKLRWPLLGDAGFLQFFDATLRRERREAELAVNAAYAGT